MENERGGAGDSCRTVRVARARFVFMTARADGRVHAQLLEAGAVDCLYKPFTESTLLGAVSAALEGSR